MLKLKAQNARMALYSSHPTPAQAIEAVRALTSHWSHDLSDERLDSIAAVFTRFPHGVVAACVSLDGIANTKIRDTRTGRVETRRFVPSTPEIRDWCNEHLADLHEMAKAGEIVCRPVAAPPSSPERSPPTPEDVARAWAIVNEIKERCRRIEGRLSEEERRVAAGRFLEARGSKTNHR
jgi:hypothetical protein